ncbi:MAG: sensor histidine kinase [Eubacteriaceae bacterium]
MTDKVWIFARIFLDVYPFIFLQFLPLKNKLRFSYIKAMLICTSILLLQFLGFVFLESQSFFTPLLMYFYRIGSLVTILILSLYMAQDAFSKMLFMFSLMTPYVISVIAMGAFISQYLNYQGVPPYMVNTLCRMGVIFVSFPFVYKMTKKFFVPAMKMEESRIWWYAFPVPFSFTFIGITFVNPSYELNGVTISELLGMLLVFVGCIFTCFFLLKALAEVWEKAEIKERERQSLNLIALQKEQYETVVSNSCETKEARHDLRHHLSVISDLLKEKKYEKLSSYLSEYIGTFPEETAFDVCKNVAINSVVCFYMRKGKAEGIKFDVFFQINDHLEISDTDLCIILGNAIENAIEGARTVPQEGRFIKIRGIILNDNLLITVDNSFDGVIDKENEGFLSRKHNFNRCGIGLESIKKIVKKGKGSIKIENIEEVFMLSILLPLPIP